MGYEALENQMKSVINSLESGKEFFLRDVMQNPQPMLGRKLYEAVQNGDIPNVKWIENVDGVNRYKKL